MDATGTVVLLLLAFAFYYPLMMSCLWMLGGTYYYFHRERHVDRKQPPAMCDPAPLVSILVPCHNEADNIEETIAWLAAQEYPNFEIIAINDGSTDQTAGLLETLTVQHERLRVIHLANNAGKAMALRTGALAANGEFLVCIDGDALLDKRATHWLVHHFEHGPRVGAVTGNPRIRNRSTLLGKLQVGEFSSIIGLIKRAQRIYGRIFTVSGVIAAYRKQALQQAGYWSTDIVTDDIDISWRMQLQHWDIRYEPNALCWILMPESFRGLWRQRLRWAVGGMQVFWRYAGTLLRWRHRRFWGVWLEFLISALWAHAMTLVIALFLLGLVVDLPPSWQVSSMVPQWHGVLLAFVCLLQFAVSMRIDRRYEQRLGRKLYWMIWYPIGFWLITMVTTVAAGPMALMRRHDKRATWTSPDRGIQLKKERQT